MMTQSKPQEHLVLPFVSKIVKKPIVPGNRITKGEWSKPLNHMGFHDWLGWEDETEDRKAAFLNHVKWDIAHRNYSLLKPCISIDEDYDKATQRLNYTIDLYGDGREYRRGHVYINQNDYLLFYMRMSKPKRKDALMDRIALSNIGMLVPYVLLDNTFMHDEEAQVQTSYWIVL